MILYVVSLSDYDEMLYEASSQNSMIEALECFERTVNGEWFQKKRMIILFSKQDILIRKITEKDDLKRTFREYDGKTDPDLAIKFIMKRFLEVVKENPERITPMVVNLTDHESIKSIDHEILKSVDTLNLITQVEKLKF